MASQWVGTVFRLDPYGLTIEDRRYAGETLVWLAGIGLGGPAVIAIVAGVGESPKTAKTFVGLTIALVIPAGMLLGLAKDYFGGLKPTPEPSPPRYCVEHSGGDNNCPTA